MSEKAVSVATLARVLICGDDPRVPCLGVWSEGGRTPAASWQKPSPWFCQQFAGLCWWYCGSQVQLRFLWCGRNWFESVPRAVQMLRSVLRMKTVFYGVLQVYRPPRSCGECMLWISESLFLTLITLQYSIYHSELFFLTRPLPPPHWQAVTHIPVVTVNRTGAVFADRPWTLWRDVWLCGNARLVAAQFQTVTL